MLVADIGHEAGCTFAQHRPHMAMCQTDFCSAVLHWMVTEQQYDFSVNTAICKLHTGNLVKLPRRLRRVVLARVGYWILLLVSFEQMYELLHLLLILSHR